MKVGSGFWASSGLTCFSKNALSLRARNKWNSWQACDGEQFEFFLLGEIRPIRQERELPQPLVAGHAVEELAGLRIEW